MQGDMPKELPRTLLGETGGCAKLRSTRQKEQVLRKAGLEDVLQHTMPMSGIGNCKSSTFSKSSVFMFSLTYIQKDFNWFCFLYESSRSGGVLLVTLFLRINLFCVTLVPVVPFLSQNFPVRLRHNFIPGRQAAPDASGRPRG